LQSVFRIFVVAYDSQRRMKKGFVMAAKKRVQCLNVAALARPY
jgi:hypothetical protein